jgi:Alginate export
MVAAASALRLMTVEAAAETPERPAFKPLRQDEDWSVLCDPALRAGLIDRLKCVPLAADGSAWLSLGGEIRERYEYTHNPLWGEDPQDDNGVFLQRYILQGDLRAGPNLRLFGQLYSALAAGRAGPTSPVDENQLDVQQAFVELSAPLPEDSSGMLRAGRQELRYGSGRLVDVREGPNVRRKFDGGLGRLTMDNWRLDLIAARPADDEPGFFDDGTNGSQALWGSYVTGRSPGWLPFGSSIDLYYLGYRNDDSTYEQGTDPETRHTAGVRLWGEQAGWDWNWELVGQAGEFGHGDIRAGSAASDTGYTWDEMPLTPRLGLSANIASGDDDPDDPDLETFNPLYPRGSYFSEVALLGPRNFYNLHPFLTVNPSDRVSITTDVDFFWRLQTEDGIYSPSGQLLRSGAGSDAHYVGTEISLNAGWQVTERLAVTGVYAHFFPGRFVEETGPSKDVDYFELTVKFQF